MAEGCGQEGGHRACCGACDGGEAPCDKMPCWEMDVLNRAALQHDGKSCSVAEAR